MLICGDCSARNKDGERFCSNCGAYLVWQQAPAEAEEQRPMPARTSTGPGTSIGPGSGSDVTTAQLPIVPGPPDTRPAVTIPGNVGVTATRDATDQGAPLDERQPGKAGGHFTLEDTTPPPRDESPQFPGGLICRRCGAGNKTDVNFCRQCGASLKEAAPAPPVPPWWRQIFSRSKPPALPAGTRPRWRKQRRFPAGAVSVLTVLGLFVGVAFLGRQVITAAVLRGVDEIWEAPAAVQNPGAFSSLEGRGAELAFDGSVRSWASKDAAQPGVDYLEAGFSTPLRLTYVTITSVSSGGDQDPATERRPVKVEIVAFGANGDQTSLTVKLNDSGTSPQSFYVGADQTSTVKLTILESTPPEGGRVSVAEVQFAGRR